MHRERVSENVYWFQSEVYAQVTAGVIVGDDAGSKADKARDLGVPTLDEPAFLALIGDL